MVIIRYLFVIYLKKKYLDNGMDTIYIEISSILNSFRLIFQRQTGALKE
jgi:hypothetical protein